MSETVLPKLGIEKIDVISHATGGGGGGLNPIDPTEQEDEDKGVPVSDEGKTLPYECDFISGVKYDNVYGFLGVDINPNFLEGKFVNQIRYIGINDTKYEYATINKDKSHWYKIFIPYKYLEPGLNDVYFYMDDITYKLALELGDEFSKEKIAPKVIALENTDGVNVELKLKMVHEGEAERKDYYGIIRESLNKNVSIIEMFTMGNLNTVVKREDFDVSLDEEEDILTIQFKNDKQLYQSLYV